MIRSRGLPLSAGLLVTIVTLAACTSTPVSHGSPAPTTSVGAPVTTDVATTPASSAPSSPSSPSAPPDAAHAVFAAMSQQQRVGQLFMVGATSGALDPNAVAAINDHFVGSVILDGNNNLSIAQQASIDSALQAHAGAAKLFIATDQEGGEVRRLQGPGFSNMPSALVQGTYAPATLRADAKLWGSQLAAAGINLDLAPVMDTVPSASFAPSNAPIGALDREFGYTPQVVAAHGTAVVQGLLAAGVDSTIKHFPGLGRVTSNTDTSSGVTDGVTTRADPYLSPFAAGISAGTPFVMMSTAIYSKIDPNHPAAFSPTIVGGILRGNLHFGGVIISDDLGAAQQVASFPVGQRAVDFIAAGGDLVLTIEPGQIATMTAAVLAQARASATFAAQVNAAALVVLEAKAKRGLLG
jgi:beta-N-acetylhexosaminidase